MLLFLTTNMATVTSRASQQYFRSMAIQAVVRLPRIPQLTEVVYLSKQLGSRPFQEFQRLNRAL